MNDVGLNKDEPVWLRGGGRSAIELKPPSQGRVAWKRGSVVWAWVSPEEPEEGGPAYGSWGTVGAWAECSSEGSTELI